MKRLIRIVPLLLALWPGVALADAENVATSVTGIVTSLFEADTRFVLQVGEKRILAECATTNAPPIGALIRIDGKLGLNRWGERLLMASRFDKLSAATVPAPVEVTPETITRAEFNLRTVRTQGRVIDIFVDEIDSRWVFIVTRHDSGNLFLAVPRSRFAPRLFQELIDAVIESTGTCLQCCPGQRVHLGAYVSIPSDAAIRLIAPPPSDPFEARPLGNLDVRLSHEQISRSERRSISGFVTAVWQEDQFLVKNEDGENVVVYLSNGRPPPNRGDYLRVVGFPETDFFRIDLIGAIWRLEPNPPAPVTLPKPIAIDALRLYRGADGNPAFKPEYHGQRLKLRGLVQGASESDNRRHLVCGQHEFSLVAERGKRPFDGVLNGSEAEVIATCILDSEHWNNGARFPRVRGYIFVVADAADITILSRPSWWTPLRFLLVISLLTALLVGIAIWNRLLQRLVRRKSRELVREQLAQVRSELRISERTALAIELHDALSQNLTGLAFQLASMKSALAADPAAVPLHLTTAERMLISSRTELKRCLVDLRGNTLEEKDFNLALRRTIAPVAGQAKVQIRFAVSRQKLSDTTAHSILCIIRELVANAVQHGHATQLRIAGETHAGLIAFAVSDNGSGFEPEHSPGIVQGHFGLDGIRERVSKLDGEVKIVSSIGQGTRVEISQIRL